MKLRYLPAAMLILPLFLSACGREEETREIEDIVQEELEDTNVVEEVVTPAPSPPPVPDPDPEPESSYTVFYVGLEYGEYTEGWGVSVFNVVQTAIDAAPDKGIIYVLPGDYRGQPGLVISTAVYVASAGGGTVYFPRITITGGKGSVGSVPDDAPDPDPPDPGKP